MMMTSDIAPIGHNSPPYDAAAGRDQILRKAEELLAATLDLETAQRMILLVKKARAHNAEVKASQKAATEPHDIAIKGIKQYWSSLLVDTDIVEAEIGAARQKYADANGRLATEYGPAATKRMTREYVVTDYLKFIEYAAKRHDPYGLLERQINEALSGIVETFLDEENDIPPGVTCRETETTIIR